MVVVEEGVVVVVVVVPVKHPCHHPFIDFCGEVSYTRGMEVI